MALIPNRRSVMTLFSAPKCPHCHRVRMVLAEKGVAYEVVIVDPDNPPQELLELNPYNSLPTLIDRELVLYDVRVINEYLDERFPHPPLMPVDPVARAQTRLAVHRIEQDWYSLLRDLEFGGEKKVSKARKALRETLTTNAELFATTDYFLNEEFSILDCAVGPIIWRLPHYSIELPAEASAVKKYGERVFERESFQEALTETEKEMRL